MPRARSELRRAVDCRALLPLRARVTATSREFPRALPSPRMARNRPKFFVRSSHRTVGAPLRFLLPRGLEGLQSLIPCQTG